MSGTCPSCRHVVHIPEDTATAKCPNCGAVVPGESRSTPIAAPGHSVPAPPARPPTTTDPRAVKAASDKPIARPASIVAFIAALLFFIPVITQAVSIVAAAIALLRSRRPNERRGLAWAGLIPSLVFLPAWWFAYLAFQSLSTRGPFPNVRARSGVAFRPGMVQTRAADADLTGWEKVDYWAETMEQVHDAAKAFHRDYKRWPKTVDKLTGSYLPKQFELPDEITYLSVPREQAASADRVLLVSSKIRYDLDGDILTKPHRIIVRLSGKVETLPSSEVDALLANQSPASPPETTNENTDHDGG